MTCWAVLVLPHPQPRRRIYRAGIRGKSTFVSGDNSRHPPSPNHTSPPTFPDTRDHITLRFRSGRGPLGGDINKIALPGPGLYLVGLGSLGCHLGVPACQSPTLLPQHSSALTRKTPPRRAACPVRSRRNELACLARLSARSLIFVNQHSEAHHLFDNLRVFCADLFSTALPGELVVFIQT